MAYYFEEPSHTFGEYLLVPGYSSAECIPANVDLEDVSDDIINYCIRRNIPLVKVNYS